MEKEMRREFVQTVEFDASWDALHQDDDALRRLQSELMNRPSGSVVIPGTGGLRKTRFAIGGRGKSGGVRVIFLDMPDHEVTYLMLAYQKNQKVDLSIAERRELKAIVSAIKRNHGKKGAGT
jgi:hypothetical protein